MARVLISLPDELLKQTDEYCKTHNYLRSEFIRYILRAYLNPEETLEQKEDAEQNDSKPV